MNIKEIWWDEYYKSKKAFDNAVSRFYECDMADILKLLVELKYIQREARHMDYWLRRLKEDEG